MPGAGAAVADAPPTPKPRPADARALADTILTPIAAEPRPRLSPTRAPQPPARPLTVIPPLPPTTAAVEAVSAPEPNNQAAPAIAEQEVANLPDHDGPVPHADAGPAAPPSALEPVGDLAFPHAEPDGVPIARPTSPARTTAEPEASAVPTEAPPAPVKAEVETHPLEPIGDLAPARPDRPIAKPVTPEPAAAEPVAPEPALAEPPRAAAPAEPSPAPKPAPDEIRTVVAVAPPSLEPTPPPASEAPVPEAPPPGDRLVGDPAPPRPGPLLVPVDRPEDHVTPPRPPLDDQSVTRRADYGPPEASPLMATRQCVFPSNLAVAFTTKGQVEGEGGCGIANAVELTSVGESPAIVFASPPLLSCAFANAFATFLVRDVQPLAEEHLMSPVVEIGPGAAYVCRSRNNDPEAKLSEHALGNAFDLQAMRLADDQFLTAVGIARSTGAEKAFWDELRKAACKRFKTVLGPGSNPLHADHLHFDIAKRKRGGVICE